MSKRKIKYTDEPLGEVKLIADFWSPPELKRYRQFA